MKTKIITLSVIGVMLLALPFSKAQNILTDGDFSTTTELPPFDGWYPSNVWATYIGWDAGATASVIDGVCNFQINNGGEYTYSLQLIQAGFPLEQGHRYRLSFEVKADADRTFGVYLGEVMGSWTSILGYDKYTQNATTEWQTISLEFNAGCVFYYHKLSFEIGLSNISMYFDNVLLEDLGLYEPSIGIIGSSVYGWDVDQNMLTDDGIIYYLTDFALTSGIMRFRQDDMWCNNWGGDSFPDGIAYLYGPNIPIINGSNYDITFNLQTGEYSFVCVDNCHPYLGIIGSAVPPDYGYGPDVNMSTNDGILYHLLNQTYINGEAKFRQDDDWVFNWGGATFPSGTAILDGPPIPVVSGGYDLTFNLQTGEYNFTFPGVGILGTSLIGWDDDIDLLSTDGIIYTLPDYPFAAGEVKFRLNNNWDINWGGYDFPYGYSWQDGPNIPVPEGRYDVTFNRQSGEYSFMATTCPVPGIQCPEYVYTGTSPGMCSAIVEYPEAVPAPYCGGEGLTITQTEGLPSGSEFPVGVTTNTYLLTNADGNTASCSFDVYVFDWEAPVMTGLTDYFEPLWPPNHQMVPIHIDYELADNCEGEVYSELYVYSNEPESGLGDGDQSPDWIIIDEHNLELRAERSGNGDGRIYYIYIYYYDENWNYNYALVTVMVPHDKGKIKTDELTASNKSKTGDRPFMLNIWPNPSGSEFKLEANSNSDETIRVYITDLSGRRVSDLSCPAGQTITFGNELLPGVYFLHASQGSYAKTVKIVKD
jgi:hypothetical protein